MARAMFISLLLTVFCSVASFPSQAGEPGLSVPTSLSYQGYLADASGQAVSGGFPMSFSLYGQASGGSPVWQETHASVTVLGGFFQVELGLEAPLELSLFDGPLFLGISIDQDPEIVPRSVVGSLPFARRAEGLLACAEGQTNCFGLCALLSSDPQNCGACGNICPGDKSCIGGQCMDTSLTQYFRDADADGFGVCDDFIFAAEPSAPYTATVCGDCNDDDPSVNPGAEEVCNGIDNNCNGVVDDGAICDDDNECTADICDLGCMHPPLVAGSMCSLGMCDGFGTCVQCLSPADCGSSTACATFTCTSGLCGVVFAPPGTICEFGGVCDGAGTCIGTTCDDGFMNGQETDVDCGGPDCDPCADGLMCAVDSDCLLNSCFDGICQCQSGQTNCGGFCRDLQNDPDNCGTCGNVCPSGVCTAGECQP